MIKLKPCPFCGSEMIQVEKLLTAWVVHCLGCNTYGPGEHETADQAAKAWNKRKDFKTKSAALYGKSVNDEEYDAGKISEGW